MHLLAEDPKPLGSLLASNLAFFSMYSSNRYRQKEFYCRASCLPTLPSLCSSLSCRLPSWHDTDCIAVNHTALARSSILSWFFDPWSRMLYNTYLQCGSDCLLPPTCFIESTWNRHHHLWQHTETPTDLQNHSSFVS